MKTDNNEINKIIDVSGNAPPPRPILPLECKCGCGHTFQPRRIDQEYINKQHADFGYNHNVRKIKNRNRKEVEKILMSNDRILEKHFKADRLEKCVTRYYDILKADGFNFSLYVGQMVQDNLEYYFLYNYCYHIYMSDNTKMINIYKR